MRIDTVEYIAAPSLEQLENGGQIGSKSSFIRCAKCAFTRLKLLFVVK